MHFINISSKEGFVEVSHVSTITDFFCFFPLQELLQPPKANNLANVFHQMPFLMQPSCHYLGEQMFVGELG